MISDSRRIIQACMEGDPLAQKQLYDAFAGKMFAVCYRYTKSADDAQDVLQEGFINVFRNLHQYKFDGEVGAWIRRIMVNTALSFLKQTHKFLADTISEETIAKTDKNNDPLARINAKELLQLIKELPVGYQTIFNLYAIEGYTHVEIAQMLNIGESTSRSQYLRARNLLISWLNSEHVSKKTISYAG